MKIDRQVLIDLLPVYFSGEASDATRNLVEECFREDPDLERIARSANRSLESFAAATTPPDQEKEKATLTRARDILRSRNVMLGFSVAYGLVPLILFLVGRFFAPGAAHNLNVLAFWFAAYAAACWIAFFALNHRAKKMR